MSTNLSSELPDNSSNAGSLSNGSPAKYDQAQRAARRSTTLRSELSNLKSDLDALMTRASTLTDQELSEANDRIAAKFSSMRYAAKGMAAEAGRQLHQGVDATSDYVKDKPLQSVAIAAGIGLFLGLLAGRR